ncbi:hypothetical protein CPC16_001592 [Podila verticillata]|nr:hypothetical protein BGZ59_010978 [Podila verticillata]KAF9373899.1 hypothetical protein CPC16_001592 [Podila verticillata]KFH73817.1 hypothetical protein MVEG_01031 [Podila verticillata NRRL 6337]
MARTFTLRVNSTDVALDSVNVRGIRPMCLSCGHKIDRGQQRLVFTEPDAHKRHRKNELCHIQVSYVDALSPDLKALAYAYWKQRQSS